MIALALIWLGLHVDVTNVLLLFGAVATSVTLCATAEGLAYE